MPHLLLLYCLVLRPFVASAPNTQVAVWQPSEPSSRNPVWAPSSRQIDSGHQQFSPAESDNASKRQPVYWSGGDSNGRRRVRQVASASESDFTWKATKTPSFVTSKLKKQTAEPILRVYPPDTTYRSGRSRELILPPRNSGAKRIIYYATLPDVARYPTSPPNDRYSDYVPLPPVPVVSNQQRSYDPHKAGKDFVTRVQSSIIDVRPKGDAKNKDVGAPTFTIIDAPPPTAHPGAGAGVDRIMYPDYHGHMTGVDYHMPPHGYAGDKTLYQRPYPTAYKTPYSNSLPFYNPTVSVDKSQYHLSQYQYQQQQQQQQSSPYYGDVEKVHGPPSQHLHHTVTTASFYNAPPYPSRHTRFPSDRYPLSSPFSDLASSSPLTRPHSNLPTSSYHHPLGHSAGFGVNGPSAGISSSLGGSSLGGSSLGGSSLGGSSLGGSSLGGSSLGGSSLGSSGLDGSSGFDFDDTLNPTSFDHSSDLDYHRFPNPLKDKFSSNFNFENLGQKYLEPYSSFNSGHDFPFKYPSFNAQLPHVSDWLTNKPSDWITGKPSDGSPFEWDDFKEAAAAANAAATGQQDYHIKGSSSISGDSHGANGTANSGGTEANNTIITPFTTSISNGSEEARTTPS